MEPSKHQKRNAALLSQQHLIRKHQSGPWTGGKACHALDVILSLVPMIYIRQ
jgi:hypothetical protein